MQENPGMRFFGGVWEGNNKKIAHSPGSRQEAVFQLGGRRLFALFDVLLEVFGAGLGD